MIVKWGLESDSKQNLELVTIETEEGMFCGEIPFETTSVKWRNMESVTCREGLDGAISVY